MCKASDFSLAIWSSLGGQVNWVIWGVFALIGAFVALVAVMAAVGSGNETSDSLSASSGLDTPVSIAAVANSPTATVDPSVNRLNCDAIRGTDYYSPQEREWFLTNCTSAQSTPTQVSATERTASFTLDFQATTTSASTILVNGTTNLPDGAVILISAQRAQRLYGETDVRASSLQPDTGSV